MKLLMIVLLTMMCLTSCTNRFDGFDPTTATVRWLIKNDLKRTSVHITPSAIPCTATLEAAIPVEVWSLCSYRSTCTETIRVNMNKPILKRE